MAVYNDECYVGEAIESILQQTYTHFEFIIVNDGSTDATGACIASYRDNRIYCITIEKNEGLTKSLNRGIRAAHGKYIARMDADDTSMPERLEKQVAFMEHHADAAVCGTGTLIVDGESRVEQIMECDPDKIAENIYLGNQLVHSATIMRREVIETAGLYNEDYRYAQDYELWFRLLSHGDRLYNIPDILHNYRVHSGNVSTQWKAQQELCASKAVHYGLLAVKGMDLPFEFIVFFRQSLCGVPVSLNSFWQRLHYSLLLVRFYRSVVGQRKRCSSELFAKRIGEIADLHKLSLASILIASGWYRLCR